MKIGIIVKSIVAYLVLPFALASMAMASTSSSKLPTIRRIVFDVDYDSESKFTVPNDDFLSSGSSYILGPHAQRSAQVTIDVVAAPGDGSLVADVSEKGASIDQNVRVGVTNRELKLAPNADVTEEERLLLHFLARDLIGPSHISVGEDWHDRIDLDGTNVDTEFKIRSIDLRDGTFDASLDGSINKSFGAADVTMSGSVEYDLALLVPISIRFSSYTRRLTPSLETEITSTIDATLVSDSFDKPSLAPNGEPTPD